MTDAAAFPLEARAEAAVAFAGPGGPAPATARPGPAEACQDVGPCPTGDARLTPGFGLKARCVVHAVGPVWMGGQHNEDRQLGSCYRLAMSIADRNHLATIAFPAISTGIYGFPLERATFIALRELAGALQWASHVKQVTCACYDAPTLEVYRRVREQLGL